MDSTSEFTSEFTAQHMLPLVLLFCHAATLCLQITSQALPKYFETIDLEGSVEFGLWKIGVVQGRANGTSLNYAATSIHVAQAGAIVAIVSCGISGVLALLLLCQDSNRQAPATRGIRLTSFFFMVLSGVSMTVSLAFFLIDINHDFREIGSGLSVAFFLACLSVFFSGVSAIFLWNIGRRSQLSRDVNGRLGYTIIQES